MKSFGLFFILWLLFSLVNPLRAQGDGPRAHLLVPKGVWAINPKYLHLNQNLLPAGNILIENLDISIDVFPTTLVHSFSIKGQLARFYAMINPGSLSAKPNFTETDLFEEIHASGFSDGFLAFEIGLIGAKAIDAIQFSKQKPQFSLMGYFRYWYSGSYDSEKIINLGTNRATFEIAAPMVIPLHKEIGQNATWLEIFPSIQIFTDNNDPARGSFTEKVEQDPMLIIESHLTHNFTKKLWLGADLRYQYGGTTYADGQSDDNLISALGGGVNVGYQFLPPLSAYIGYGTVLNGQNNISSDMLRFSLVFAYINLKKLQANSN